MILAAAHETRRGRRTGTFENLNGYPLGFVKSLRLRREETGVFHLRFPVQKQLDPL